MKNKLIAIFVFLTFVAIFFIKIWNKVIDFPCYYLAGKRFFNLENLYVVQDQWPYKYPPIVALFFSPLSIFPYKMAMFLFYTISFSSMLMSYYLLEKIFEQCELTIEKNIKYITFVLLFRFHLYDYANLQINHLTVLILLAAYFFKDRKYLSPILFSIGGIFKMIPLAIAGLFFIKKEFRYFLYSLLSILALALLPAAFYGVTGALLLYKNYAHLMAFHHTSTFGPDGLFQSVPALVGRLSLWIGIENESSKWILFSFLIAPFVINQILIIRKNIKTIFTDRKILNFIEYACCLIFVVLINPVGWRHGHLFLLPATFIMTYFIITKNQWKTLKYKILFILFLIFDSFTSSFFVGKSIGNILDKLSFNTLGAVTLLVFMQILSRDLMNQQTNNVTK